MIVSCPACATRFSLDAALLGEGGRSVRCAKCGHKWKQLPPKLENPEGTPAEIALSAEVAADAAPAPGSAPENTAPGGETPGIEIPAAPPRPRSPQRPTGPITVPPKLRPMMPKRRFRLRPAYLVLAGMAIGLGAVFIFRAEIARAIPALDMVYSLMGISTSSPAEDLETANLVFNRRNEDGKTVYSVQADVFNKSEYPVKLPVFVIKARDADRKQVGDAYPFRLEQETIEPGETITFRTFMDSLPKGTKTLRIEFVAE
ncbi:zinc-ribbon domain-containing protein [Dongia rigui]|uniref:Zinc-ribbon domain-containing protein n=1 Tax=Dongia rigui TaxID=940149 RepID=A0ABU5E3W5_9PROT|nr:zinc-ribbon domain-containing protein [Dongia rigui]MDY0873511.1 zinc-ribbon domain-containing protein [Dongia rigui]